MYSLPLVRFSSKFSHLVFIQDERDKLFEDFESAREAMEQLKQEKRILMDGKYVSQAEVSPSS